MEGPKFYSIKGTVYTPSTIRPTVMRMLRGWADLLPHLDTKKKRSQFASAWLEDEKSMRWMNGYTPGAVARAIEKAAVENRWPEGRPERVRR